MIALKEFITIGGAMVGFLMLTVLGKRWGWYELIGGTNKLLKEQNQELRNQNAYLKAQLETTAQQHEQDKKDWTARHAESLTEIAKLQGRVETLTAVPLRSIDKSLDALVAVSKDNARSNELILAQLQVSAAVAKSAQSDDGLLVKTKEDNPLDVKPVEEKK